ncbi:MAG: ATP-binding cassette domain-containing protein [Dermatophilaceae bacterium]
MTTQPVIDRPRSGLDSDPVIRLRGLTKDFQVGGLFSRRAVRALNSIDLDVERGEIMALVGESGSGKSTIARCVIRLEQPTSGQIFVDGIDVLREEPRRASQAYRGKVQMIFQDPFGSLNPIHQVRHFLERAIRLHTKVGRREDLESKLVELMETVDLPGDLLDTHAFELSGGQRQRVAIARALAMGPKVILADEPTSMLDVSVRIGILNLMRRLRDEKGISMLYITHDLASARYVANRTTVMFAGELVESGLSTAVMDHPAHPYTQLLLSAVPDPDRAGTYDPVERARLRSAVLRAASCPFSDDSDTKCSDTTPVRHLIGDPSDRHWVRCHLYRPAADVASRALAADPTDDVTDA